MDFEELNKKSYSNRVVAINPGTKSLFEKLGAWDYISSRRKCSFDKMFVWDHCSTSSIEFKKSDKEIGHIIENDVITDALNNVVQKLRSEGKLNIVYESKMEACDLKTQEKARIVLGNNAIIESKLVIGADGANSQIRKAMGVNYISKDYKQMGVVGTVTLADQETSQIAFQKFLPTGPIALLPLREGLASLVWTMPTEMAKEIKTFGPEDFAQVLNASLTESSKSKSPFVESINSSVGMALRPLKNPSEDSRITSLPPPTAIKVENVASFPLGLGHAERYITERAALVGDSAHRVHPLAGQGVNLGYGDVQALIKALESNVKEGQSFIDSNYLNDYETSRMRHNLPIMAAIDSLQQLYCTENPLAVLTRSVGLQMVNSNKIIKDFIMSAAS